MAVDLHIHTSYSDGILSPEETVLYAKEKGLKAIAVTDHDTVAGIEESLFYGEQVGLNVVPGVELSIASHLPDKGHLHLVGLFINHNSPLLNQILEHLRLNRKDRINKFISNLNKIGINISITDFNEGNGRSSIGRPHIASILLKKGYVSSLKEAFNCYLKKGSPTYVEKIKLNEQEGINIIKKAGGLAILAHPVTLGYKKRNQLKEKILQLKASGLDGLEVFYSLHNPGITRWLYNFSNSNGLVISGGSDFHGEHMPGIEIGSGRGDLNIPDSLYNVICKYHKNRR